MGRQKGGVRSRFGGPAPPAIGIAGKPSIEHILEKAIVRNGTFLKVHWNGIASCLHYKWPVWRRDQEKLMGFAQRLKKLEINSGRLKQSEVNVPEIERTDEEWADWIGDYLWWPKGANMDKYPRSAPPPAGPLRAWHEAVERARQEGHRDYHVGLRPDAMEVWLAWKPEMLNHRRTHGEWIWDIPPRINTMTMEEFEGLSPREKVNLLMEPGKGHWSKDRTSQK
jgi:hypothetical protein